MQDEESSEEAPSDPATLWRDRDHALKIEDEEGFESDI
jgi:hypothetical protein